jgi:hypothetical protein
MVLVEISILMLVVLLMDRVAPFLSHLAMAPIVVKEALSLCLPAPQVVLVITELVVRSPLRVVVAQPLLLRKDILVTS